MPIQHQQLGEAFAIVAYQLVNDGCPAIDYLANLDIQQHKIHVRLHNIMDMHAERGPITDTRMSRPLTGKRYSGIVEFKAGGARLFYCYLPNKVTVLLNGCDKTDVPRQCYETARNYKELVEQEMRDGQRNQRR